MGTNNFHNENASKIFAVLMGREEHLLDDEGNETEETEYIYPDEWECDDLKSNVLYSLKAIAEKSKTIYFWKSGNANFLQSFEGGILGSLNIDKDYLGITCQVEVTAVLRSGYYEGANLDWELTLYADGYESCEITDFLDEWEYQARKYNGIGLVSMNRDHVENWANQALTNLTEEVEKVFEEFTEIKLKKVGQFSNGTAVYERA
jgi:hypothetical protein